MNLSLALLWFTSLFLPMPQALMNGQALVTTLNTTPAGATYTFVQGVSNGCGASGCSCTISPTVGNLVLLDFGNAAASVTIIPSDNASGGSSTWNVAFTDGATAGGGTFGEAYSVVKSGVTAVSFTGTTGADSSAVCTEYSISTSRTTATVLDQVASTTATGTGTTETASPITTTATNELIAGSSLIQSGSFVITGTNGFTNRKDVGWASRTTTALSQSVSSLGTYAASGTMSSSTWYARTVSYK